MFRTTGSLVFKRCSHIGRSQIPIPADVHLDRSPLPPQLEQKHRLLKDGYLVTVSGPQGSLDIPLPQFVSIQPVDSQTPDKTSKAVALSISDRQVKEQKAIWGLSRSLIANAVHGVSEGHVTTITLKGVGYRATMETPTKLSMKLGFPNNVIENVPQGITATTPAPTQIVLKGADKQLIGQFAARIRNWRKPEPYNEKGNFVNGETIKRKEVKKK